jgi:GntR family transcriptional regulator of gluconate operon
MLRAYIAGCSLMASFTEVPDFQPIWEVVRERIRAAILSGQLVGGTKLIEADLADQFKVSRGPVREALRELGREGLVVDLPRRGTIVCTITQSDLIEVYAVREALEIQAVRDGVNRATQAEMARISDAHATMDRAWTSGPWIEAINADKDFHLAVIALAKNRRLATVYEQMVHQTVLLLVSASETDATIRGAPLRGVHQAMADAIVARDIDLAITAVQEHYKYTRSRLFTALEENASATASSG